MMRKLTASDKTAKTKARLRHFATSLYKFDHERELCRSKCNSFKLESQLGCNQCGETTLNAYSKQLYFLNRLVEIRLESPPPHKKGTTLIKNFGLYTTDVLVISNSASL